MDQMQQRVPESADSIPTSLQDLGPGAILSSENAPSITDQSSRSLIDSTPHERPCFPEDRAPQDLDSWLREEFDVTKRSRQRRQQRDAAAHWDFYPWKHFRLPRPYESSHTSRIAQEYNGDRGENITDIPNLHPQTKFCEYFSVPDCPKAEDLAQFLQIQAENPDIAPHTCMHCSQVCFDLRIRTSNGLRSYVYQDTIHFDSTALFDGDCLLLQLLCKQDLKHVRGQLLESDSLSSKIGFPGAVVLKFAYTVNRGDSGSLSITFTHECWFQATGTPSPAAIAFSPYQEMHIYMLPTNLTPRGIGHTSEKNPWPMRFPPNLVPDSNLSYNRAQAWIEDCEKNHPQCQVSPEYNGVMPKRVMELRGSRDEPLIRLVTDPASAAYAALSYCWGQDQPAKTTMESLSSYERSIKFQLLPKTIQDAVLVTLSLGIPYLWVDAMCIVQDDDIDKSLQISQMHTIYRCSTITIAASIAAKCNEDGFLRKRQKLRPVRVTARLSDNTFQDVLVSPINSTMEAWLPLFGRAWTFQETHLSRRLLSYNDEGMIYRCLQGKKYDGGSQEQYASHMDTGLGLPDDDHHPHPRCWAVVVMSFTKRRLTLAVDKLPAIAAMAEEYSRQFSVTEYYAGLWKEDFLVQLLWKVTEVNHGRTYRPAEYVAPSWSWACRDKILTCHQGLGIGEKWCDIMDAHGTKLEGTWLQCCTVLDVATTIRDSRNPFGTVTGGCLRLSAAVRPIICRYQKQRYGSSLAVGREAYTTPEGCLEKWPGHNGQDPRITIYPDTGEEELINGKLLWCIEIVRNSLGKTGRWLLPDKDTGHNSTNFKEGGFSFGLVLQRQEGQHYSRVGLLEIQKQNRYGWLFEDSTERQIITII